MLSEKDRELIERTLVSTGHGLDGVRHIALAGQGYALDDEDWAAILNAARHQAQEEAKAVSVEGLDLDFLSLAIARSAGSLDDQRERTSRGSTMGVTLGEGKTTIDIVRLARELAALNTKDKEGAE